MRDWKLAWGKSDVRRASNAPAVESAMRKPGETLNDRSFVCSVDMRITAPEAESPQRRPNAIHGWFMSSRNNRYMASRALRIAQLAIASLQPRFHDYRGARFSTRYHHSAICT